MDGQWWSLFQELLRDVWAKYGPFAALLILVVVGYNYYVHKLWSARLKDKEAEVDRLVAERDRLHDIILPGRLSSGGKK